jgi:3-oxoacyl-[acyl-carrier protein] reductase
LSSLSGRIAVVTGGTKGIGRAIAEDMVREDMNVLICSRSEEDLAPAADGIAAAGGGQVEGVVCDVRDPVACEALVRKAVDDFGGLDVLVNNAGLGRFENIATMSVEDWQLQIDTNLGGVFYCSRAAIPALKQSDDAWIINIGSLASRNSFAGGVGYNASKFGLLGMSEAMMLDLRYDQIRVSLIMPGSVNTYFNGTEPEEEGWRLEPDDVARAVMDLLRYPARALASRVELRPSKPPRR